MTEKDKAAQCVARTTSPAARRSTRRWNGARAMNTSKPIGPARMRYGVSLTRLMEQGRKKENFDLEVHENWIPADSPYWETASGDIATS
jgi:hypothetical protein